MIHTLHLVHLQENVNATFSVSCPKAFSSWVNMPSKATNNIWPADIFGVSWPGPSMLRGWISSEYWARSILRTRGFLFVSVALALEHLQMYNYFNLMLCWHEVEQNSVSTTYLVMWRQRLCPSWSRPTGSCKLSTKPCRPRPSELCSTSCSNSANMDSRVGSPLIIQRRASGKIICRKLVFSSYNEKWRHISVFFQNIMPQKKEHIT